MSGTWSFCQYVEALFDISVLQILESDFYFASMKTVQFISFYSVKKLHVFLEEDLAYILLHKKFFKLTYKQWNTYYWNGVGHSVLRNEKTLENIENNE